MEIISDIKDLQVSWQKATITLGDFDGFHLGHRRLIKKMIRSANENAPPVLVTYDPSPKKVLSRLRTDSNIYTKEEKIIILQRFPIRAGVFIPFDLQMAQMSASHFLKNILIDTLKASHIILGHDHCFGRNRHGNYSYLKKARTKYDFEVNQIKAVSYHGLQVSSSRIRKLLKEGDIKSANKLLVSPYLIMGVVIRGRQRGRQLGLPTANLRIPPEKLIPKEGVYYCSVQYGSEIFKSVVNIGFNPTFENVDISIEAHILNFNRNIYGETLKLYFHERIRDEKKFNTLDELKMRIQTDIDFAKKKKIKVKNETIS